MKKKFLTLILILSSAISYGQKEDAVINKYIRELSWHSFLVPPTYVPQIVLDSTCQKIIASKNESVIQKLFLGLGDKNRTIVIHLILTKILNIDSVRMGVSNIYNKTDITSIKYIYNNAIWFYNLKTEKNWIEDRDVKNIKQYWLKKLRQNDFFKK